MEKLMPNTRFSFKQFISDEGLGKSKSKSHIRVGWDGRQEEVDNIKEINESLKELSLKNFDRFEETRASVVKLEELIEDNKEMVAKSKMIHEQNEELLAENKKINNALAKIAQDIANNHLIQQAKDQRIQELEDRLAGK